DKFIADINDFKEYSIKLENEGINNISKQEFNCNVVNDKNIKLEEKEIFVKQIDVDTKTIVYHFVELPFVVQTSILSKYDLLNEDDQGKKYVNIIDKIIDKAKQVGILEEMWKDIKGYY
ncbi:hypothetical protein, partial [Clostridium botulinum]